MKQKDLATKINVQPQIIQQYENGKATPDIIKYGKKYLIFFYNLKLDHR